MGFDGGFCAICSIAATDVVQESREVYLVAGIFAGAAIIPISREGYTGKAEFKGKLEIQELPFYKNANVETEDQERCWEPVSGKLALPLAYLIANRQQAMTTTINPQTQTLTLHLGSAGGFTLTKQFPLTADTDPALPSELWIPKLEELRENFDIEHDCGGLTIARIWGLAVHQDMIAMAATIHPGDNIDYRSAADKITSIAILPLSPGNTGPGVERIAVDRSTEAIQTVREKVIGFILLHATQILKEGDIWGNRIAYAAACCTILQSQEESLRSQARAILERLATTTGADLSDEISKCASGPAPIPAKTPEQLNFPGEDIFEKCDICGSGISWDSPVESQCTNGHLFGRPFLF